ncbi:MAG TPA: sulfite exporter TauE/SafE family protein [Bacteroidales bacterium]|nr:sulfite exporter TauE/SafE family protein [Bacteroidales bacterium]
MKMTLSSVIILALLGLLTGFMAGMLGIGGGIIVIPALTMILGFTQQEAQGTSLAMMLPPVGIIAVMNYYKAGHVDWRVAGVLALLFIVGSVFGSKLAIRIPQDVLKKVFGIFLILVALKMLFGK